MKLRLDSHSDSLHEFARLNIQDFDLSHEHHNLQIDIPKLRKGGVNALFWALFTKQEWGVEAGRERINLLFNIFQNILIESPDLEFTQSPDEILETVSHKGISISLGVENGMVIDHDWDYLNYLNEVGIRYLTLCHKYANQICDSSTDEPVHGGLSDFGIEVVKRMNKLGMMIDVSHASDQTVQDVLLLSEKPIIASHSNARALCDVPRNLPDDLLTQIASNGGVVQVSALPKCVADPNDEVFEQNVQTMVEHIGHIVGVMGIDHVGIGSDFDGGGKVRGFEDISKANNITKSLAQHGFEQGDIDKIWGLNFMRVYEANFNK